MATQNEKLAGSLEVLANVQQDGVVRSSSLSRTHRERLIRSGFLKEIINGWLIVTNPGAAEGDSTVWYASFWSFVSHYLQSRFADDYCLAPEASLKRHVGADQIPRQVGVVVRSAINQTISFPFGTSLVIYQTQEELPAERTRKNGLWLMGLPDALCRIPVAFFRSYPEDAEIALRMLRDPGPLLRILLTGSNVVVAGRLAGAYAFLGEPAVAERIRKTMAAAGQSVRTVNPFEREEPLLGRHPRVTSPHVARIRALWTEMRPDVLGVFPATAQKRLTADGYLAQVEERYAADAYNSLSIEGYRVTPDLIRRVHEGGWQPDASPSDSRDGDALAARGYYQAFQAVKESLRTILGGASATDVAERDFQGWHREMFAPAVLAGVLDAAQIAGYRNHPVYLRGSRYVPPAAEAVLDAMDALFDLFRSEDNPAVRAVLGHFVFVYIHPYPDGNGRIGRFLMNTMFCSGGYPWTVIRNSRRTEYLAALETASTLHDIGPFATFISEEMHAPQDAS